MTIFPFRSSQFVVNTQAARSHSVPNWDSPSFGVALTQWVPSELKAHAQTAATLYVITRAEVTTEDVCTECLYTERVGVAVTAPHLYSKVLGLESWPGCYQQSRLSVLWVSAVPSRKCRTASQLLRSESQALPFEAVQSEKPTASYSNLQNENNFLLWMTLYVWKEWSHRFNLSYLPPPTNSKKSTRESYPWT
jgi:hypothetical protein